MNTSIPWQLLQSMAAIGETGSLSAAARHLNVSQPTLSRHINTLEDMIGVRLFVRTTEGMHLTVKGEQLFSDVRHMADAAGRISNRETQPEGPSGTVRISASQIIATHVLPEMLTSLRRAVPNVDLEVVASDTTQNLIRREADIAIRMYRPNQSDLFIRKVADMELGIFARRDYLQGKPDVTVENFMSFDVVGYDRSTLILDGMAQLGIHASRDEFAFRSDDQVVCWNMVNAGFGIGMMQVHIAERNPDLVRLSPNLDIGHLPVWLAAHKDLKNSPRFRVAFDHLADSFAGLK